MGFPDGPNSKEFACDAGDPGSIPGSSPMDRGAQQDTVHGVSKSRTQLSDFHFHYDRCEVMFYCDFDLHFPDD